MVYWRKLSANSECGIITNKLQPIARMFGPYGGDVGVYMSGAITLLVYPIARTLEKKYFKR